MAFSPLLPNSYLSNQNLLLMNVGELAWGSALHDKGQLMILCRYCLGFLTRQEPRSNHGLKYCSVVVVVLLLLFQYFSIDMPCSRNHRWFWKANFEEKCLINRILTELQRLPETWMIDRFWLQRCQKNVLNVNTTFWNSL